MRWCAQVGRLGKKVGKFKKGCRLNDNGDQNMEVWLKNKFDIGVWGATQVRMEGRKETS